MTIELPDFTDPTLYRHGEPHELWRLLRAQPGLHRQPAGRRPAFWCAVRHADVMTVLRESRLFSCESGMTVDSIREGRDPAAGQMLELTDPPAHRRLRRLLRHAFLAPAVDGLRKEVESLAARLFDEADEGPETDFLEQVAKPLPVAVNAIIVGLSVSEAQWIATRTSKVFLSAPPGGNGRPSSVTNEALRANMDLLRYFERRFAGSFTPRGNGGLLEILESSQPDGESLTRREQAANALNLVVGGNESTKGALSNVVLTVARNPHIWEQMRRRPELLDVALEELVRFQPPARHVTRKARAPGEVAGTAINQGDVLVAWLSAANFDEEVFVNPHEIDIARRPNPHLSFGAGPHVCIGAAVARLQLRTVLGEMLRRYRQVELVSEPEYLASNVAARPAELRVRLRT